MINSRSSGICFCLLMSDQNYEKINLTNSNILCNLIIKELSKNYY